MRTSIEDWKKTPWRKIDVENMDIECKKFAKDVRLLDKEMRTWDAYLMLEATVKNMLTSLRAVGELQNPAIRERHWIQLMASTKVRSVVFFLLLLSPFSIYTVNIVHNNHMGYPISLSVCECVCACECFVNRATKRYLNAYA